MTIQPEPASIKELKDWLKSKGGYFNDDCAAQEVPSGTAIIASADITSESTIVACPFSLAITEELAQRCLSRILPVKEVIEAKQWTDRQWLCTYISFHWIIEAGESSPLQHYPYVKALPSIEKLQTPLYFTALELRCFEGTNLYGATLDRNRDLEQEYEACHSFITTSNPIWAAEFTWEKYRAAATYISSRAFPSSVLSATPSLIPNDSTKLVLLPGVDSLNHERAQPVSWVVNYPKTDSSDVGPTISILIHKTTPAGQELLNNYGPKPNSSFILGYGFSIPNNPDDTIILKLGGSGRKWEVGRSAAGAEGLWEEILQAFVQDSDEPTSYEHKLDASGALTELVENLVDSLPARKDPRHTEMRPEVATMFRDYLEGQQDILNSILEFAKTKENEAVKQARSEGINIVLED